MPCVSVSFNLIERKFKKFLKKGTSIFGHIYKLFVHFTQLTAGVKCAPSSEVGDPDAAKSLFVYDLVALYEALLN